MKKHEETPSHHRTFVVGVIVIAVGISITIHGRRTYGMIVGIGIVIGIGIGIGNDVDIGIGVRTSAYDRLGRRRRTLSHHSIVGCSVTLGGQSESSFPRFHTGNIPSTHHSHV